MKTRLIAAAIIAAASSVASADVINVRYLGHGSGRSVEIQSPGIDGDVFAGQLRHELSGATGASAQYNGTWLTYCTDLFQYVSSSTRAFELVPLPVVPGSAPMGVEKAEAIQRLYTFAEGDQLLAGASNDLACAFQLAVWEIVCDYNPSQANFGLNMTSGSFRAARTDGSPLWSGVTSHLTNFFDAVKIESMPLTSVVAVTSGTYQDQIIPIPTPGAVALAGLGGLCLLRRRRAA